MHRLIIQPAPIRMGADPPTSAGRPLQFMAYLESTGEFVVQSHQPLADGARELLVRGHDPAALLTMRHAGKAYDSFLPRPIGVWAKVSYSEGAKTLLQSGAWVPFAGVRQTPTSERMGSMEPTPTQIG